MEKPTYLNPAEKPKKTYVPLMVLASIAMVAVLLVSFLIWGISFQKVIDSTGEDAGEAIGDIFAIIFLSIPLIMGCFANAVLTAVFAPLSLFLLRKSANKTLSIFGIVYGSIFFLALALTILRFVLFANAIY